MADKLGLEPDFVAPAYEDPGEWILKEGNLPENVTPENSKLKDPEERARIARVFARGLTEAAGHVLPVQRWQSKASGRKWRSEKWKTAPGRVFLVPGDSAVGYRLPLGTLPYVPPSQYTYVTDRRPDDSARTAARLSRRGRSVALPETSRDHVQPVSAPAPTGETQTIVEQELGPIGGAVRTAISVEPRDGRLCVFMPPVEDVEDYLDLSPPPRTRRGRWACRSISRGMGRRTIRA
jgi:uncharacterized protein (DUF2126 family)